MAYNDHDDHFFGTEETDDSVATSSRTEGGSGLHDRRIPTRLSNLDLSSVRVTGSREKETELGPHYEVKPHDVLVGSRGVRDRYVNGRCNTNEAMIGAGWSVASHTGNERFKVLVELRVARYKQASNRTEKTLIVKEIVDAVRESGGNFVKFVEFDEERCLAVSDSELQSHGPLGRPLGTYFDVGNSRAREKAGHAIRAAVHRMESSRGQNGTNSRVARRSSTGSSSSYKSIASAKKNHRELKQLGTSPQTNSHQFSSTSGSFTNLSGTVLNDMSSSTPTMISSASEPQQSTVQSRLGTLIPTTFLSSPTENESVQMASFPSMWRQILQAQARAEEEESTCHQSTRSSGS